MEALASATRSRVRLKSVSAWNFTLQEAVNKPEMERNSLNHSFGVCADAETILDAYGLTDVSNMSLA